MELKKNISFELNFKVENLEFKFLLQAESDKEALTKLRVSLKEVLSQVDVALRNLE